VELKLPPPLKSVASLPCKMKVVNFYSTIHLYSDSIENNMLDVWWHLFRKIYSFIYLFFLILTSLWHYYNKCFVCCITHSFQ